MGNINLSKFLDRVVSEADLDTYIDVAVDRLEKLTDSERQELLKEIEIGRGPDGDGDGDVCTDPEIMGALAILECLIKTWEEAHPYDMLHRDQTKVENEPTKLVLDMLIGDYLNVLIEAQEDDGLSVDLEHADLEQFARGIKQIAEAFGIDIAKFMPMPPKVALLLEVPVPEGGYFSKERE